MCVRLTFFFPVLFLCAVFHFELGICNVIFSVLLYCTSFALTML